MEDSTQKLIDERIAKLPPHIRTALSTINWAPAILEIGKKHGLHIDEMGTLQTETVLVLVGLVHPDEYADNLRSQLKIPREKIDLIVADVNQKIFKTIRQALIDFIITEDAAEAREMAQQQIQPEPETEEIFKKTGIELEPEEIPMRSQEISVSPAVGMMDRSILEHSGVEVDQEAPQIAEPHDEPDRKDILSELEHPPKGESNQFSHLIRSKLSTSAINPSEKIKYEDPKIPIRTTQSEAPKHNDPYREPI